MYSSRDTFNKILVILVCLIIVSVMFFAAYYIEAEVHHDCIGKDCPICAEIEILPNIVKQIGTGIVCIPAVVIVCEAIIKIAPVVYMHILINTPVEDKVRLNN